MRSSAVGSPLQGFTNESLSNSPGRYGEVTGGSPGRQTALCGCMSQETCRLLVQEAFSGSRVTDRTVGRIIFMILMVAHSFFGMSFFGLGFLEQPVVVSHMLNGGKS